jgi:hypothetical protein
MLIIPTSLPPNQPSISQQHISHKTTALYQTQPPSTGNIAYPHKLHVTSNTMSTNQGVSWEYMVASCQASQVNLSNNSASMDITVSSTVLASYPVIFQSSRRVLAAWLAAQLVWRWVVFVIVVIALWTWPFHTTPPIVTSWPWSVTPFIPKIKHTNIHLTILSRNNHRSTCRA